MATLPLRHVATIRLTRVGWFEIPILSTTHIRGYASSSWAPAQRTRSSRTAGQGGSGSSRASAFSSARAAVDGVAARQEISGAEAARDGARESASKLWEVVGYNLDFFNAQKMPRILVSVGRLSSVRSEREDQQLRAYLSKAKSVFTEDRMEVVQSLGPSGVVSSIAAARRLQMREATSLATNLVSLLSAEVSQLQAETLAHLAKELLRYRISDHDLWKALAQATADISTVRPTPVVELLDAFRRSLAFGVAARKAFAALSHFAVNVADQLSDQQLAAAIGSLSRLGNHITVNDQRKAIQLLLDRWLVGKGTRLEHATAAHIVSIAVSLTNLSEALGVEKAVFLDGAAAWALRDAKASEQTLATQEFVVLLWAIKELAPLGLGPHHELVSTVLPRICQDDGVGKWSLLRLVQASEVFLASRYSTGHRYHDSDVPSEATNDLEELLVRCLAAAIADNGSPEMLTRVVALWDQADGNFWERSSTFVDAVMGRTLTLVEDKDVPAAALHRLLDTLVAASFSRTASFATGRETLRRAATVRHDSSDSGLAATLRALAAPVAVDEAPTSPTGGHMTDESAKAARRSITSSSSHLRGMPPAALAERLAELCHKSSSDNEVTTAAEALLATMDQLDTAAVVPALENILAKGRRRLAKTPILVDVVERLGDLVVAHASALSTLQLTAALHAFAGAGLPYYLLFEVVLDSVIARHRQQGLSWGQVVGVLEAFAAVRLKMPNLEKLYSHLRRPHELARLPTMALIRFLSASSRLGLVNDSMLDVLEIVDRIFAETTPLRPLPLESSVVLIQSLYLAGAVLPDRHIRHLFAWMASSKVQQLTLQQLTVLRQYTLFLLSQPDVNARGSLFRLPVEVQRFLSGILQHRAAAWTPSTSDTTRRFRAEVATFIQNVSPTGAQHAELTPVALGPAGSADLCIGGQCWLLDGPESFFRPFTHASGLQVTPQERSRAWLLERLLQEGDARRCVADFLPSAALWPVASSLRRLSWFEWARTPPGERLGLLGLDDAADDVSFSLEAARVSQVRSSHM
eukprot:TRINITY_DN5519_c1_g1_i1.p1 TRINITY_DN5519_c1_g1~~TRINITY_DN5519_c1_g1_i1.p1  ORF type:complete len:1063 (-),score=123.23 TRINITY_DN5519_c1_g1_i1:9-3119(-)